MLGMREEREASRDTQIKTIRLIALTGSRKVRTAWVLALLLDALETQGWPLGEDVEDAVAEEDLELVAKLLPERKNNVD